MIRAQSVNFQAGSIASAVSAPNSLCQALEDRLQISRTVQLAQYLLAALIFCHLPEQTVHGGVGYALSKYLAIYPLSELSVGCYGIRGCKLCLNPPHPYVVSGDMSRRGAAFFENGDMSRALVNSASPTGRRKVRQFLHPRCRLEQEGPFWLVEEGEVAHGWGGIVQCHSVS